MYYQQNGNYMQDLNYYNQNPNYPYNPYMSNGQNNAYPAQNNMNMNQMGNRNMNAQMTQAPQNLSAMYPAVYRIISPVVCQVVSNNNTSYVTEDSLNSMVDTVYNIVEGDINLSDNSNVRETTTATESSAGSNCSRANTTSTGREYNNYYKHFYA